MRHTEEIMAELHDLHDGLIGRMNATDFYIARAQEKGRLARCIAWKGDAEAAGYAARQAATVAQQARREAYWLEVHYGGKNA